MSCGTTMSCSTFMDFVIFGPDVLSVAHLSPEVEREARLAEPPSGS